MRLIGKLSKKTTKRFVLSINSNGMVTMISDSAKNKKIGDIVDSKKITLIMLSVPVIEMKFRISALKTSSSGTGYLSINNFVLYPEESTELLKEIQKSIFEKKDRVLFEGGYFKAKFVMLFSNRNRSIRLLNGSDIVEMV